MNEEDYESYDLWGAPDRCIYCGITPSQYLVFEVRDATTGAVKYGKVMRHCGTHALPEAALPAGTRSVPETALPAGTRSVHANEIHRKFQEAFAAARIAGYLTVTANGNHPGGYRISYGGPGFSDAEGAWMDDCRRATRPAVILRSRTGGRDSTILWPAVPHVVAGHAEAGRQTAMALSARLLSPQATPSHLSPYDSSVQGTMRFTDVAGDGALHAADVVRTLEVLRDPDLLTCVGVLDV